MSEMGKKGVQVMNAQRLRRVTHDMTCNPGSPYQAAQGVCTALLVQEGIPVVSQRDFKTLDRIRCKLEPGRKPTLALRDHHEIEWYRGYFVTSAP
jgi:hypothetical protein